MEKITFVLNAFEEAVKHSNVKYRERIAKMEAAWSEANSYIPPKMDCMGRFHAPCDGYSLAIHLDFSPNVDSEKLYRKGEFLPVPLDPMQEMFSSGRSSKSKYDSYAPREKIKVELELAQKICQELEGNSFIEFGCGKSWQVNDSNICYLYMTAIVRGVFNEFVKAVRDAIENTEKQAKRVFTGAAYEGRHRVTGTVLAVKEVIRPSYSYYDDGVDYKMLIALDNDSSCWGSIPAGFYDIKKGDRVEFTASFTKADESDSHSFYKRPFKMIFTISETEENV